MEKITQHRFPWFLTPCKYFRDRMKENETYKTCNNRGETETWGDETVFDTWTHKDYVMRRWTAFSWLRKGSRDDLVNTELHKRRGNFLTNWATTSLTRTVMHRGVSKKAIEFGRRMSYLRRGATGVWKPGVRGTKVDEHWLHCTVILMWLFSEFICIINSLKNVP